MPSVDIFASATAGGYIESTSSLYSAARSGSGSTKVAVTTGNPYAGQANFGSFMVWQAFLEFNLDIIPPGSTINSVECFLYCEENSTPSSHVVELYEKDFGPTLTSADFHSNAALPGSAVATFTLNSANGSGLYGPSALPSLPLLVADYFAYGVPFRVLATTNQVRQSLIPDNSTLVYVGISRGQSFLRVDYTDASSEQEITLDTHIDGDSFHALTVAPDPATVALDAHTDGDSFSVFALATGEATLVLDAHTDGDSFSAFALATGEVTLALDAHTDGDSFHALTVTPDPATVAFDTHADGDSFPAFALATGEATLAFDVHSDLDSFPTLVVAPEPATVALDHVSDADTFPTPHVWADGPIVQPTHLTDVDDFHPPAVATGEATIALELTGFGSVVHDPTVTTDEVTLWVDPVESTASTFPPTVALDGEVVVLDHFQNSSFLEVIEIVTGEATIVLALFVDADTLLAPHFRQEGTRLPVPSMTRLRRTTTIPGGIKGSPVGNQIIPASSVRIEKS